jgi:hypothetical protein
MVGRHWESGVLFLRPFCGPPCLAWDTVRTNTDNLVGK